MSTMEHRGYSARIQFDGGDGIFHGRVLNIRDVVTFEGRSVGELKREFERSLAVYLTMCREDGIDPEKPFSGQFLVRVPPELHRDVARAALTTGQSVNAWVEAALERELRELPRSRSRRVARGKGATTPRQKAATRQR